MVHNISLINANLDDRAYARKVKTAVVPSGITE
jgi:hypothetical protein